MSLQSLLQIEDTQQNHVGWLFGRGGGDLELNAAVSGFACNTALHSLIMLASMCGLQPQLSHCVALCSI